LQLAGVSEVFSPQTKDTDWFPFIHFLPDALQEQASLYSEAVNTVLKQQHISGEIIDFLQGVM
jgi:hypothetical protein